MQYAELLSGGLVRFFLPVPGIVHRRLLNKALLLARTERAGKRSGQYISKQFHCVSILLD